MERMGDRKNICRVLVGKAERRRPLGSLCIYEGIILKFFLKKRMGNRGL